MTAHPLADAVRVRFQSAAIDRTPGVRTFYLSSLTGEPDVYTLKYIRRGRQRRTTCNCENYIHVQQPRDRICKHVRVLNDIIATLGGVSEIPNGVDVTVLARP